MIVLKKIPALPQCACSLPVFLNISLEVVNLVLEIFKSSCVSNISLEHLISLLACLTLPAEVLVKKMGHGAYHAFSSSQVGKSWKQVENTKS